MWHNINVALPNGNEQVRGNLLVETISKTM